MAPDGKMDIVPVTFPPCPLVASIPHLPSKTWIYGGGGDRRGAPGHV